MVRPNTLRRELDSRPTEAMALYLDMDGDKLARVRAIGARYSYRRPGVATQQRQHDSMLAAHRYRFCRVLPSRLFLLRELDSL